MNPAELSPAQRDELQHEIDVDRRAERRLIPYACVALIVIAAIAAVRVVLFS
jgi:hypothetical protein